MRWEKLWLWWLFLPWKTWLGGFKASVPWGSCVAVLVSAVWVTGVIVLPLFLWKSVSVLQLRSLGAMPGAEPLIKATQGRVMLNISPWKAALELFLAPFHVFVADTWKCSFHRGLFCGMMCVFAAHP